MLNVILLNVIILSVAMQSVMALPVNTLVGIRNQRQILLYKLYGPHDNTYKDCI
jgi:hypothetical protein